MHNVRVLVFSSVKVKNKVKFKQLITKHKTNIKLITAVAIDTNTCYATVLNSKI